MELSEKEQRFLVKRARLVEAWRYYGVTLLAMLCGLGMWLFLSKPLLANPFVVMGRLKDDAIAYTSLSLMASLLPFVVLLCIALTVMIVLFAFAAFSNEKKYLAIIQREFRMNGSAKERPSPERT